MFKRVNANLKFYRTLCGVFAGLFLAVFSFLKYSALSAPLLANYYLPWQIPTSEVANLAKYNLLVLDLETQVSSRVQIEKIKQLNPNIILLAYVTSEEISASAATSGSSLRRKLRAGIAPEWFLKKTDGSGLSFWPGTAMLNPSADCPSVNGLKWNNYLASFMAREVLATGLWNGVFYDNSFDSITWFSGAGIDLNLDSKDDANPNDSWRAGMRELFSSTYAAGRNYLVVGNAFVDTYHHDNNGIMIENFQNLPWQDVLRVYRSQMLGQPQPRVVILNGNTGNTGARADYRNVRYGLTTALVGGDGYFAFDYGDKDHGQTWWYDEYDVNLGTPINVGQSVSGRGVLTATDVYRRDFDNGLVLVNPTGVARSVDLDGEYEKIIGTQDKNVNSGSIASKINLPARDGIVLRKIFQQVNDVLYINGGMVRFFTLEGLRARNGFFVFTDGFNGGAKIFQGDLDGVGGREKIVSEGGRLRVFDDLGRIWQDNEPLYEDAPGRLNIAVGNLDIIPGQKNILIAGEENGAVTVNTYYGALIGEKKYPLGKKYKNGFSVAIGKVDGPTPRVILGTGQFSVGEVLILDSTASKILKRFYPFGKTYRGGVSVGTGDINNDGRDEIFAIGVIKNKIMLRIFNGSGKLLKEFSVGSSLGASRFSVGVAKVDTGGRYEIVVGSE